MTRPQGAYAKGLQTPSSFIRRTRSLSRGGHPAWIPQQPASFLSFRRARFKGPLVSKYSRSQSDRSLKQFRPGVCPDAVDRRFGEISSRRRTASRSPHRPSRRLCWPIRWRRASRTLADTRADPPSRFSSDNPDILSVRLVVAVLANAACCILP